VDPWLPPDTLGRLEEAVMQQHWASHKGKRRWGVRTSAPVDQAEYVSNGGELFVWADRVEVRDGCLLFVGERDQINGAFAAGQWRAVYLAALDGSPEAVETR
jgi:hypothetical protein